MARAGHEPRPQPAVALADDVLGPALAAETRFALEHAASARDSLALLFASPEFQRR